MLNARLWFSFKGRINRGKYWLVTAVNLLAVFLAGLLWYETRALPAAVIAVLVFVVTIVSGFAIAVKRLHDRNKSAWWLLFFYVLPIVLSIFRDALTGLQEMPALLLAFACAIIGLVVSLWALVELGFLRGTAGPNEYGPDPVSQT